MRKVSLALVTFFSSFLLANLAFAMTSESFSIPWDATGVGGDDISSSTNFGLRDTIGGQAIGQSSGSQFSMQSGYRVGDVDVPYLQFSLFSQNSSIFTTYTTLNMVQNFVVVANSSLFAAGDMVQVVENPGTNQKVVIGKVTFISGTHVYVDRWDGDTSVMNISPSGVNYVYKMQSASSINFGSLLPPVYTTALTGTRVSTSAPNGYTIYMTPSGGLNSGIHEMFAVTDGSVTAGQEEYGWRLSGSTAATGTSMDSGFSTQTIPIQKNTVATPGEGVCVAYKLSVISSTVIGSYTQTITYSATANF